MKLKYIFQILFVAALATSCSTDDDDNIVTLSETDGLAKVQEISNSTHTIELYTKSGVFKTGYNEISLRIKDKTSGAYVNNATMSWNPMMDMGTMVHSCPKSDITKSSEKNTIYEGFIIFQMTNEDSSGWSLTINYSINTGLYSLNNGITETITVTQAKKQNVTSFMGADNKKYIIAYIEPETLKIGNNHLHLGVYQMETMMSFPIVENYSITLDPRMPGMGNHSSPNNTDLVYGSTNMLYHGNLSLTMTGYWTLNLKLLNAENEVLKGEDVTDLIHQSSLYLEVEF